MSSVKNRALQPEEIEVRIDSISAKSITLVVYITARSAMNLLDELYGPNNWDKFIEMDKKSADTPFFSKCRIHVHDKDTDFVREDFGEDNSSPKAAASDALKRAAMNIVPSLRALYTLPAMRVTAKDLGVKLPQKSTKEDMREAIKYKKFKVLSISFGTSAVGEFVTSLQIVDAEEGTVVYTYVSDTRQYRTELSEEAAEKLMALKEKMSEDRMTEQQMLTEYGIDSLDELVDNEARYRDANIRLDERKKKLEARAAEKKANAKKEA